ncbi:hypothetical protein FAVG1_11205 [Fusarium avenaceum]|nr:hypothetical protein FAVG1_11205 [Fusarium avenaceum]
MAANDLEPGMVEAVAGEDRVRFHIREGGFFIFDHPLAKMDDLSHQFVTAVLVEFEWVFKTSFEFHMFVNKARPFFPRQETGKLSLKMELAMFSDTALALKEPWLVKRCNMPHGWDQGMTKTLMVWTEAVEVLQQISNSLHIKMILHQPYRDFGMLRVATQTLRSTNVTLELELIEENWEKSENAEFYKAMASFAITGIEMDDVHEQRRQQMTNDQLTWHIDRGCRGIRYLTILIPKPDNRETETGTEG